MDDLEVLSARDWVDLYIRTGPFYSLGKTTKASKNAKALIDEAAQSGKLKEAAQTPKKVRTAYKNNAFHIDLQQPQNKEGQYKMAIQLNEVGKGDPSTIGQVAIYGNFTPSDKRVSPLPFPIRLIILTLVSDTN